MRIGIDARPLIKRNLTGIGVYVDNIIKNLDSIDTENEFVLYTNKELKGITCDYENISIRCIPFPQGTFWLRYILPYFLKKESIDVFWGTADILPPKIKGIKYCLTVHDIAIYLHPEWSKWYNVVIHKFFMKKSIADADIIYTVSNSTKHDLNKFLDVDNEKIIVTYSGNPIDNVELCTSEINLAEKYGIRKNYILYVGTIEPRKNIEVIIKAFERVAEEDLELQLVIAGGVGWKAKAILELINDSKFRDRIILTGYVSVEEKVVLYRGCLLFVFPSHYEGFGTPIVEAQSQKAIVVTAKNSSLFEICGKNGLYIDDENDYVSLSEVIRFIIGDTKEDILNRKNDSFINSQRFEWNKLTNIINYYFTNDLVKDT